MSKRKTTDDFRKDVYDKVGNEYTVLGEYVTNKDKIKMRHNCKTCNNYEYEVKPNRFLSGDRCPKCKNELSARKRRKTSEKFIEELKLKYGDEYIALDEYFNDRTCMKFRHIICGKEFEMRPANILRSGNRCPYCYGTPKKTTEQFKIEMENIWGDEYTVLGEYKTNHDKITIRHNCEKCNNYEWDVRPVSILYGKSSCPLCNQLNTTSKGVAKIEEFLINNNIIYEREYKFDTCRYKNELPFDFYLTELNILIEFDGQQHYTGWKGDKDQLKLQQLRDSIKDNWCDENHIKLIRIPYTEYDNIENILSESVLNL